MTHKMGIRWKTLISFLLFSVVIVSLLWILEVVLLDPIYRNVQIRATEKATELADGLSDSELKDRCISEARSGHLCVSVYSADLTLLFQEHSGGQCVVHHISKRSIDHLYGAAEDVESHRIKSYLSADDMNDILSVIGNGSLLFRGQSPFFESREELEDNVGTYDCFMSAVLKENRDGEDRFILFSSVLIPQETTVSAIRLVLIFVSIFLFLASLVIGLLLSRMIAYPIVSLNREAKYLAEGKFREPNRLDYREVRELSRTLSEAAVALQKNEALRKELIANVSHDLRTPLTLIAGYSEAMRDLPGENNAENLQIIIDETKRLSALVTDLLDLSRLDSGTDPINVKSTDLVSLVAETVYRYRKMTAPSGYNVFFESTVPSCIVSCDEAKLVRVINNLISNAVSYCGRDRTVRVRVSGHVQSVLVEVVDRGDGIEKEALEHIWDRYYRASQQKGAGTGLGLSIVRSILELHRAEYGVESVKGEGSRFWFRLPKSEELPAEKC